MRILLLFLFIFQVNAQNITPAEKLMLAERAVNAGDTQAAMILLEEDSQDPLLQKKQFYLRGINYFNLQSFRMSALNLEKSVNKESPKDTYFRLAQAYYALKDYPNSKKNFFNSIKNRHNINESLYYLAYISQQQQQFDTAEKLFNRLTTSSNVNPGLLQPSYFQIGEMKLAKLDPQSPDIQAKMQSDVIPYYEKAIKANPSSALTPQIEQRLNSIKEKIGIGENQETNLSKPWSIRFEESLIYDDNVTYTSDDITTNASDRASSLSESHFSMLYQFGKKNITLTPKAEIDYTIHQKRENPQIYQNDQYTITGSLKASTSHKFFSREGKTHLKFEHSYNAKDRNQQKEIIYQNRTNTISLTEIINFIKTEETGFTLKSKNLTSYDENLDTTTYSLYLDQTLQLNETQLLFFVVGYDVNGVENDIKSNNLLLLRTDWIKSNFIFDTNLSIGVGYAITDTKKEKAERGNEKNISASSKITKKFNQISVGILYDYQINESKSISYKYNKQKAGINFSVAF